MRALTAFMTGVTRLNNLLGRWFSYLVMIMFLLLITGVAFRYLLEMPLSWTGELTQLIFGVYGLMAGGYLLANNGHVNVDLVYSKFSRRKRAFLDLFTSILFFMFTLALLYFAVDMAWESFSNRQTSNSSWDPPIWPVKAFIPLATLLLILQGIVKLLQDIAIAFNLSYYQPEPEPEESREDNA
ncbi:TRAP transporter small permease subunit [Marinobacter sp. HL-58]|uniref:TRAP transporter small permease subunit n=1 Tax=Marinobacter sp. HL-58 TaxID=1479237 RepID=UPI000480D9BA|nr:TRAP transporter small permease subunit [Marinobacter sp. HL-58]KPP96956.1 MAG: TRAP-type transport system small permease component [Marinobacter sp. HL-58]